MNVQETVIKPLYELKDCSREETLQEIIKWLEDNFYDYEDFDVKQYTLNLKYNDDIKQLSKTSIM